MAQSLSNLPIGAFVRFGNHSINGETPQPIMWRVVAKNHNGYPSNSVTLISENIIDLRAIDAKEPTNTHSLRKDGGNGYYPHSNISQWLNSAAESNWYTAQHQYDAPPTNDNVRSGGAYSHRPGFLYHFSEGEKNAILSTSIRCIRTTVEGEGADYISAKVFLPSTTELNGSLNNGYAEGEVWERFRNYPSLTCRPTMQVINNTTADSNVGYGIDHLWWTRSANYSVPSTTYYVTKDGQVSYGHSNIGNIGIRPALNLSSTQLISDTANSDGAYSVITNASPPAPTTLNVPTIYGGKAVSISWGKVTDPDGDAITYQLESSVNGGAFTTIYSGANLSYTTTVAYGSTSVQFRLKAIDSQGASSGYITSTSRTVINNNAPVISGTNSNLGTKDVGFTQTYTIQDAESNSVTVTESIDGTQVRSYVASLGATNTFSVTGNTWLRLTNGTHTMTITATDGIDSSTRTYTFTKSVSSFSIQNSTPIVASTMPTRIKVSVTKTIPPEATFKVEVCNNGYDSQPVWEDATSSVNSGLVHLFSNTTKTAANWGVCMRVTVNRNGGSGECYVSAIGGNFE